jgi:hypothetical protein
LRGAVVSPDEYLMGAGNWPHGRAAGGQQGHLFDGQGISAQN